MTTQSDGKVSTQPKYFQASFARVIPTLNVDEIHNLISLVFESSEDDFTHYNAEMRSPCAFLSVRVTMRFYRIKIRSLPCDGVHCLGFNSVPSMFSLDKGPKLKPWCEESLISTIQGVSMTIIKSANKDD